MPYPRPNPLHLDLETQRFHEPSEVEQAIWDLLAAYLPATSTMTSEQAAKKINALYPANRRDVAPDERQSIGGFIAELWEVIFRFAPHLDYRQEPMQRYIALHKAIPNLPVIVIEDDSQWINGRRLWQDLPYWHMSLTERWNQISYESKLSRNFHGFLAHLTNDGFDDCTYVALSCISNALESWPSNKEARERFFSGRIPAAVVWFSLCSPKLYEACMAQVHQNTNFVWSGRAGYSIPRWEYWRTRFEDLKRDMLTTEETKQLCKAAIKAMDAATEGT